MKTETLKEILMSGAVSAAVSFGVVHAASVTPMTQASAAEGQHAAAVPSAEAQSPSRADGSAPASIQDAPPVGGYEEAHSDGGYWEWLKRGE